LDKRIITPIRNRDSLVRCPWALPDSIMQGYHDKEWGLPVHNDSQLLEFIILEGAQAGLSWITVLKRRDSYRKAFDSFDPLKIASYDENKIEFLMSESGIIKNRKKIESAVINSRALIKICEEFASFDSYIWRFTDGNTIINYWNKMTEIPGSTKESETMSRDLIKRGFRFVGPTICYAFMQAVGMVNDHLTECYRWKELQNL